MAKTFIHSLWFVELDWHIHMFWLTLNGPLMCLIELLSKQLSKQLSEQKDRFHC